MAVGAIHTYIKEILQIERDPETIRFYRGQASLQWELQPTIFREANENILKHEQRLLKELQVIYPDSFSDCLNSFEVMVKAQHYDIPTRLLDITSNPLVALYFACEETDKKGNAIVYIFDIPKEKILFYDNDEMLNNIESLLDKETCQIQCHCVRARLNNPRIIRQSGAFLLYGNVTDNTILNEKRIEIVRNRIKSIKEDLMLLNISNATLFPELPSYAKDLKNGLINI